MQRPPVIVAAFALCGLILYANALDNPFIYDDIPAIVENSDIRKLWPPAWLEPSFGPHAAVNGRPVVSLSLALNYALDGLEPRYYRVFNLVVHVSNALLLCALVRWTVRRARSDWPVAGLGLACAALWLFHPLASQCINYVIQRTELLMAFFYLTTLYAAMRGMEGGKGWQVVAVLCCALGMASKEVMVSAPVMVLCYDRTFVAGSFTAALRRGGLYGGLAATWGVLALLQSNTPHGSTVGSVWGAEAWNYALNQPGMVLQYVKLSLWPHPLVLDYGFPQSLALGDVWWSVLVVLALLALAGYGFFRWRGYGFLGLWFFAVLAPTSSVVPLLNEVGAERRVYLALAALIVLAVVGGYALLRREGLRWVVVGVCVLFGYATVERNGDYRSELSIWRTVASARPDNPRGHNNLGKAHYETGALDSARAHYRRAVELKPRYAEAWGNLGLVLYHQGDRAGAIGAYERALGQDGGLAETWYNLGLAHHQNGDLQRAVEAYTEAVARRAGDVASWYNMGVAQRQLGAWERALRASVEVNKLAPELADGWLETGRALWQLGDAERAALAFGRVLELRPGDPVARAALRDLR